MIRLREIVERLEPYRAGKPAELVALERGLADVVKLASNESPYPPLPSVQDAIARAAQEVNRYPDDDCTELREALADRLRLPVDRVTMGCGSIDVCLQAVLATVDPGGEVLTGWPTFNAYPLLVDLAGGITRTIGLRDGRFDLPAMAGRVHEGTRLVILCNPNNPTGTAISHDDMAAFLGRIPPDLLVVVDEAYREFADGSALPDSLALAEEHHNLLLLRTFSKAHGLAGLRVGYGIASAGVIGALRKVHVPFAVSRMAQRAALASLQVEEELRARVREVVAERERLAAALTGMGFAVPPSQANFVLVPVPGAAEQLADACERCGVIVRPLGADLVRVTVGTPAENDRLLATLPDAWSRTRPVTE